MHEWTEELWSCENKDRFDVTLKSLLTKKAEELVEHGISHDRHGRLKARHILGLEAELKSWREGKVTEEMLRKNDGYIAVGKGCELAIAGTTRQIEVLRRVIAVAYPWVVRCPDDGLVMQKRDILQEMDEALKGAPASTKRMEANLEDAKKPVTTFKSGYNVMSKAALSFFREMVESQPYDVNKMAFEFRCELLRKLAQEGEK